VPGNFRDLSQAAAASYVAHGSVTQL